MTANDEKFLKKWGNTRQKGKTSFMLKGAVWALLIAVVSGLFAQFELPSAATYLSYEFLLRITVYTVAGTLLAAYWWKVNNKRFDALEKEEPQL